MLFLLFHWPSTQHFVGISTILFTVILTIPTINRLYAYEEKVETRQKNFFKAHAPVIDFFIYFFIGVFVTFFVLAILNPASVFSEKQLLGHQSAVGEEVAKEVNPRLPPPPESSGVAKIGSVFVNNVFVMLIAFVLSIFYGAGAIFLIVLNASIFATALADAIRIKLPYAASFSFTYFFMSCNLGVIFFHMLPEFSGYLLAAIAGGVISKATLKEKMGSPKFWNVVKDGMLMLAGAILLLFIAAVIEIKVSIAMYQLNTCMVHNTLIGIIFLILIVLIFIFEFWRNAQKAGRFLAS